MRWWCFPDCRSGSRLWLGFFRIDLTWSLHLQMSWMLNGTGLGIKISPEHLPIPAKHTEMSTIKMAEFGGEGRSFWPEQVEEPGFPAKCLLCRMTSLALGLRRQRAHLPEHAVQRCGKALWPHLGFTSKLHVLPNGGSLGTGGSPHWYALASGHCRSEPLILNTLIFRGFYFSALYPAYRCLDDV